MDINELTFLDFNNMLLEVKNDYHLTDDEVDLLLNVNSIKNEHKQLIFQSELASLFYLNKIDNDTRLKGSIETLIYRYKIPVSIMSKLFHVDQHHIEDILNVSKSIPLEIKFHISIKVNYLIQTFVRRESKEESTMVDIGFGFMKGINRVTKQRVLSWLHTDKIHWKSFLWYISHYVEIIQFSEDSLDTYILSEKQRAFFYEKVREYNVCKGEDNYAVDRTNILWADHHGGITSIEVLRKILE